MCAFMPASANWIGSIPAVPRSSASGRQARGTAAGVPAARSAAKYRLAKFTSRLVMKAGSAKNPWPRSVPTVWVTCRYIRLKQASPSLAGSPVPIASMSAIASATEVTGSWGIGGPSDMGATIRSAGLVAFGRSDDPAGGSRCAVRPGAPGGGHPAGGREAPGYPPGRKIMQLLVACAYSFPAESVSRAVARAVREPRCSTVPSHSICPVREVICLMNLTERSSEV